MSDIVRHSAADDLRKQLGDATLADLVPWLPEALVSRVINWSLRADATNQAPMLHAFVQRFLAADDLALAELLLHLPEELAGGHASAAILARFMPQLPETRRPVAIRKALDLVYTFADVNRRAAAIAALAPFLDTVQLDEVQMVVRDFVDPAARALALVALAASPVAATQNDLRAEALGVVSSLSDAWLQSYLLTQLAPHLSEQQRTEAQAMALRLDVSPRAAALTSLALHGNAEAMAEALDTLGEEFASSEILEFDWLNRREAILAVLRHLPDSLLGRALSLVRALAGKMVASYDFFPPETLFEGSTEMLGVLARRLPPSLVEEALAIARVPEAPIQQAQLLTVVLPYLAADRRAEIAEQAYADVAQEADAADRVQMLVALSAYVPAKFAADTLVAVREIEAASVRADALAALIPYLPPTDQSSVQAELQIARATASDEQRAEHLQTIFEQRSYDQIDVIFRAANEITDETRRAALFQELAPSLTPSQRSELRRWVLNLKDQRARAHVLLPLMGGLYGSERDFVVDEIIAVAETLPDVDRLGVLIGLHKWWPGERLNAVADQILEIIARLDPHYDAEKARALVQLSRSIPDTAVPRALQLAYSLDRSEARIDTLVALFPHLTESDRRTALDHALAAAWALNNEAQRQPRPVQVGGQSREHSPTEVIQRLASNLTEATASDVLNDLAEMADERGRVDGLAALGSYLPDSLYERALAMARALQADDLKAEALSMLAPHMPEAVRSELVNEALALTLTIDDPAQRAQVLETIASFLSREQQRIVAEAALQSLAVQELAQQRELLLTIGPYLTSADLDRLLEATGTLDPQDRAALCVDLAAAVRESADTVLRVALDALRSPTWQGYRAWLLQRIIADLPADLGEAALEAIALEESEEQRARLLASLAPKLQSASQERALKIIVDIGHEPFRGRALVGFAPYLTPPVQDVALRMARDIVWEGTRAEVLAALAPVLRGKRRRKAQAMIRALSVKHWRIYARTAFRNHRPGHLAETTHGEMPSHAMESMDSVIARVPETLRQALFEEMIDQRARVSEVSEPLGIDALDNFVSALDTTTIDQLPNQAVPVQERYVGTGFVTLEQPDVSLHSATPLERSQRYYYWVQIDNEPIAGALEDRPTLLPQLPADARLSVALFSFENEIVLTLGNEIGSIVLHTDGSVTIEQPPEVAARATSDPIWQQKLFFPVTMPARAGRFRLRCNIYYQQILLQSRVVSVRVMRVPYPVEHALRVTLDYTLTRTFDPALLSRLERHDLSIMLNSNGDHTHTFRFFGADGGELWQRNVTISEATLGTLIDTGREALRRVSWGTRDEWQRPPPGEKPANPYLYEDGHRDLQRLAKDLARLATTGYRIYDALVDRLAQGEDARLESTLRDSRTIQIALVESANQVLPAAIIYDYPWDSNAFDLDTTPFQLCDGFRAALESNRPLETSVCFQGACPLKAEADQLAAKQRQIRELGPRICPSGFWGYRHSIGEPLSLGPGADGSPIISFQHAPQVTIGVSTDPDFRLRENHELDLRTTLYPNLGWNRAVTRTELFEKLLRPAPHLVYFYCHGGQTQSHISYIEIGQRDIITGDNLRPNHIKWVEPHPLVFLNGCRTGALTPEVAMELISAFVTKARAAGVIGTEITIFEPLACAFAKECLSLFFTRIPIGEAIRRARLKILKEGNPLGLVYIPFAPASLRLLSASG